MENGEKLYQLRIRLGLTLEQAADCIGIHKSTLCRYEQSFPETIRREVLERICTLYQVPEDYFCRREKKNSACWFRILTPEEVSAAYAALPERDQIRISSLLTEREIS